MEAVIRHSMLNPLASCFVPSNIKVFEGKSEKSQSVKKDYKRVINETSSAVMKFNHVFYPDKRGNMEKLDIFQPITSDLGSEHSFPRLVNEDMHVTKDYINLAPSKTKYISWSMADVTALLKFLLVALLCFYNRQNRLLFSDVVQDEDEDEGADASKEYKSDKCDCPPMFGCIIPPDFFGNPFGLNYNCNKKQGHVCYYETGGFQTQICNLEEKKLDKRGKSKLEQYSNELGEIVKDVCEMVRLATDDDTGENSDYNEKINSTFEQNPSDGSDDQINVVCKSNEATCFDKVEEISSNADSLNLENIEMVMGIPKDTPIMNDFRSLLDEGISVESEDEVKKIVGSGLSLKNKRERLSFDPEEMSETSTCDPPCSIWCDSPPRPSKNVYRKFIETLSEVEQDLPSSFNKSRNCISTITKPLFKRSLSENDGIMPEAIVDFSHLSVSSEDLLRKRARSYGKFSHLNQKTKVKRCQSLSLNELPVTSLSGISSLKHSKDNQSGMWGPFDGEDSLWQPLPDCAPTNEHNLKHSTQKRVREMKSQWF